MELDSQQWNAFILKYGPRSGRFLQSWEWGEFQRVVGEQVERYILKEASDPVAVALVLKRSFPLLGSYWYLPKGPVASKTLSRELLTSLLDDPAVFSFRIEPKDSYGGLSQKTIDLQPAQTNILDLHQSEEDLLSGMHQKTRYNIRLADRKGVRILTEEQVLDDVWSLFEETGTRGGFRLHTKTYFEKMLRVLSTEACRAFLATAWFNDQPIASTIMLDFGETRTYLHGASDRKHGKLMAPYLLHWELIQSAKKAGFKWYDWWGVAPEDATQHPWEGISRFKRGFGGDDVKSPGTLDVVLKPGRYTFYSLIRAIRRKM
jgi:peptidoglycan pentaglycine glycine transferase (the first glycine)